MFTFDGVDTCPRVEYTDTPDPAVVDVVFCVLTLLALRLLKSLPRGVPGSDKSIFGTKSVTLSSLMLGSMLGASVIMSSRAKRKTSGQF